MLWSRGIGKNGEIPSDDLDLFRWCSMVNHHSTTIWENMFYFVQASNKQIEDKEWQRLSSKSKKNEFQT